MSTLDQWVQEHEFLCVSVRIYGLPRPQTAQLAKPKTTLRWHFAHAVQRTSNIPAAAYVPLFILVSGNRVSARLAPLQPGLAAFMAVPPISHERAAYICFVSSAGIPSREMASKVALSRAAGHPCELRTPHR